MKGPSVPSAAIILAALLFSSAVEAQTPAPKSSVDPATVLDPEAREALALQVALDRAGFSPGEIDASRGKNTTRALAAYQAAKGAPIAIDGVMANALATYAISAEDADGPFVESIPADMMEKSKLPALSYTSIQERLAERFHASPKLLQRLNPGATFTRGELIVVPNVEPFTVTTSAEVAKAGAAKAAPAPPEKAVARSTSPVTITVTDRTKTLQVVDAAGNTIFHAPVTVGSERDPLPVGEWKVTGVSPHPTFNYNPDLFWDADAGHAKARIPAGPNNPVGVVWIDLSKPHYGIHGTPEPSRIGYTESHGCIRLTNWDAMRLAALVAPSTKVVLQ